MQNAMMVTEWLLCIKEILKWSMFEGDLGFAVIGNSYILSFKLMVSVGFSMTIWIIVFWSDYNGKFFTIQPLDFILCVLIRWIFFTSISEVGYNVCGAEHRDKMLAPLLKSIKKCMIAAVACVITQIAQPRGWPGEFSLEVLAFRPS